MTNLKLVSNSNPGTPDVVGGDDWDSMVNTLNFSHQPYTYLVYKEGSNFVAKKDNWDVSSTNSDALTVLQYAVDNAATRRGLVLIKGEKGKWYNLTGPLSLVDKNVTLKGLYNPGSISTAAVEGSSDDYGGVVFKKNFATTEPLIDQRNTVWTKNSIENISVIGNSTASDFGIRVNDGREKQTLMSNVWVTGFDTGVELKKTWYANFYNLNVYSCTTTGLTCAGSTGSGDPVNTLVFLGGRIAANPVNFKMESNSGGDVQFHSTILETTVSTAVHSVQIESGANMVTFYSCSFETAFTGSNPVVIYDNGNNNRYISCRFDSFVDYTPINFRSSAKNNMVSHCIFQANTAGKVGTILLDSGSINTGLYFNSNSVNTVGSTILTDNSGGSYNALGNVGLLGGSNLTRFTASVFPSKGYSTMANNGRMWGYWFVAAGATGTGLLTSLTLTGAAIGFTTFAAADGGKGGKFTPAASSGAQCAIGTATSITCPQFNPRVKMKFRLDNNADTRMFMGFNNTGGVKTGDDPLNASPGIMFGKIATATNSNFLIMHNDTSGATVLDTVAAADNSIHQIELRADNANSKWWWSFDNGAETGITADIPAATSGLGWIAEVETTNTTQPLFHIFWVEMESG